MIHLTSGQRFRLLKIHDFLSAELSDLSEFLSLDFQTYQADRHRRRDAERCIENIVNASIDIAKVLIAVTGARIPDTYREMFLELGEIGLVPDNVASQLAEGAGLRNKLAHEYLDIRWNSVRRFLHETRNAYDAIEEITASILRESEEEIPGAGKGGGEG